MPAPVNLHAASEVFCLFLFLIVVDVFLIAVKRWFRSQRILSPLDCQWKLHIPLGDLPCSVLKEDQQSYVPEPRWQQRAPATCFLRPADIRVSLTCMKRDLFFVLTWTLLSSGRHWEWGGGFATPGGDPGRAYKSNRTRRGLAWPRGTAGIGSQKVGNWECLW